MVDTVKIPRPKFQRRENSTRRGRVEHDARGNAVWVRTRAEDPADPPDTGGLSLADEQGAFHPTRRPKKTASRARRAVFAE
jgi:hypothetical protein